MNNIFNEQTESQLDDIVKEYRGIYEKASFMSVQMAKMEEEMKELMETMAKYQEEENAIYIKVAEEKGLSIDEVKQAAGALMIQKQTILPIDKNISENAETIG